MMNGDMMEGFRWMGGYGGVWVPILVVVVVVVLAGWVIRGRAK